MCRRYVRGMPSSHAVLSLSRNMRKNALISQPRVSANNLAVSDRHDVYLGWTASWLLLEC